VPIVAVTRPPASSIAFAARRPPLVREGELGRGSSYRETALRRPSLRRSRGHGKKRCEGDEERVHDIFTQARSKTVTAGDRDCTKAVLRTWLREPE
jgi:hypothetical protein